MEFNAFRIKFDHFNGSKHRSLFFVFIKNNKSEIETVNSYKLRSVHHHHHDHGDVQSRDSPMPIRMVFMQKVSNDCCIFIYTNRKLNVDCCFPLHFILFYACASFSAPIVSRGICVGRKRWLLRTGITTRLCTHYFHFRFKVFDSVQKQPS